MILDPGITKPVVHRHAGSVEINDLPGSVASCGTKLDVKAIVPIEF